MVPLDLLVIAPHPDDAEISVGGIIIACRQRGLKVGVVELTNGEPTPQGTVAGRLLERDAATAVLDLSWRGQLNLPNRKLENTLEARRLLAEVIRETRPRVLLSPYWDDAHPDHVVASRLADDARFWAKLTRTDMRGEPHHPQRIYYYFSIHLRIHPRPACVVDVSTTLERKLEAIRCYRSQNLDRLAAGSGTSPLDDIRDRARYWGWTIQTRYGEPLASREELGIADPGTLF